MNTVQPVRDFRNVEAARVLKKTKEPAKKNVMIDEYFDEDGVYHRFEYPWDEELQDYVQYYDFDKLPKETQEAMLEGEELANGTRPFRGFKSLAEMHAVMDAENDAEELVQSNLLSDTFSPEMKEAMREVLGIEFVHPDLLPDSVSIELRETVRKIWEIENGLRPGISYKRLAEIHAVMDAEDEAEEAEELRNARI